MAKFALLENNVITNIIAADTVEDASMFGTAYAMKEGQRLFIGDVYNPETDTFTSLIKDPNA